MEAQDEPISPAPPSAPSPSGVPPERRGSAPARLAALGLALLALLAVPLGGSLAFKWLGSLGGGARLSDARVSALAVGLWLAPFAALGMFIAALAAAWRFRARRLAVALAFPLALTLYFGAVRLFT